MTEAGASRDDVDEMTTDQAAELLLSRIKPRPANRQPIEDLARRLGEWPVLLSQFNGHLRQRLNFSQNLAVALDAINQALDRKGVTVLDHEKVAERHRSVTLTIEVSLDHLGDDERLRYTGLAIFPEDEDVPLTTVAALWGMDSIETETLVLRLGDLSLIKLDLNTNSIRLHDVMRHYLVERLANPAGVHARLLDAWSDLHHLPDAHAWRWVAYHLEHAGRREMLRTLLLDFAWLRAKLAATDPNALIGDYAHFPEDVDLRLIQGAIRLSSHILSQDANQIASQLHGRLMSFPSATIRTFLDKAAAAQVGTWLRPLRPSLTRAGGPLLRILTGHSGSVYAVAVTGDGRALSGSSDRTVRLWDLESGHCSRVLQGHSGGVREVAVTGDGRALSGSDDHTVRVWDLESGACSRVLQGHAGGVRALAVTGDGRVLSGSQDQTVRVWDLDSGHCSRVLQGHSDWVTAVAVTADGRALSGSEDRTVRVWNLKSGQCSPRVLQGHSDEVRAVAVTGDGRALGLRRPDRAGLEPRLRRMLTRPPGALRMGKCGGRDSRRPRTLWLLRSDRAGLEPRARTVLTRPPGSLRPSSCGGRDRRRSRPLGL